MCKKIFSLSILLLSSMMMIFSCCEAEKEEPENKPAPASPQTPVITAESKKFTYEVNGEPEVLTITASVTDGGKLSYQWYKSDTNYAFALPAMISAAMFFGISAKWLGSIEY